MRYRIKQQPLVHYMLYSQVLFRFPLVLANLHQAESEPSSISYIGLVILGRTLTSIAGGGGSLRDFKCVITYNRFVTMFLEHA